MIWKVGVSPSSDRVEEFVEIWQHEFVNKLMKSEAFIDSVEIEFT